MTEEEIDRMKPAELREELRRALRAERDNREKWSAEERRKDTAMQMAQSARIRVQCVQAIRLLSRHMREALGSNAEPNIDIALIEALKDLDRADEIADVIPF